MGPKESMVRSSSDQDVGVEVLHSCHASTGKIAAPLIINTCSSRIRPRGARTTTATAGTGSGITNSIDEFPKAYRMERTVEKTGRLISSTKKRILWSFGLTNQAAQRSGKRGTDCRGEEHIVELVHSMVSKKTRVFWNKRNVSNLFRNSTPRGSGADSLSSGSGGQRLEFSWQTRGGETVQIVAHSESVTGTANLFIDGTSFDCLPHISDLGCSSNHHHHDLQQHPQHLHHTVIMEPVDQPIQTPSTLATEVPGDTFDGASTESMSDMGSGDPLDAPHSTRDDLGYRLSMVGLSSGLSSNMTGEPVDELHSELYSPMLESLRRQLTECLPQTEEMISRAIIQAFFSDCGSSSHDDIYSSSTASTDDREQQVIEADALWEAREWVSLNVDVAPRPDAQELALSYMQKQIEGVFVRVRNDDISSEEAARQLLSVAAVLGLSFNSSVPVDTIILVGLDKATPVEEFFHAMKAFGQVQAAAISSRGRDFAFCRFMDESAVNGVQEAAKDGRLQVGSSLPYVSVVAEKLYACDGRKTEPNTRERRDDDAPSADPPLLQSDLVGHESAVFPHLMGPLSDDGEFEAEYMGASFNTPDHLELMKSRTESTSSLSPASYRRSPLGSPDSLSHTNLKSHSHHNLGSRFQHGNASRPRFV